MILTLIEIMLPKCNTNKIFKYKEITMASLTELENKLVELKQIDRSLHQEEQKMINKIGVLEENKESARKLIDGINEINNGSGGGR